MSTETNLTAHFYMRGNHCIVVDNFKSVEMTRDSNTGGYSAYKIEWISGQKTPSLFTLSIPDIVAVVVTEK